MRLTLAFASLLVVSCGPAEEQQREDLMDEIERMIRLPASSRSLQEYARYYTFDEQRRVVGLYTTFPAVLPNSVPAGERVWLEEPNRMPRIDDGGCGVVNVLFQPRTHRIEAAYCNFDA